LLHSLGIRREDMLSTVEGRARQWRSATHDLGLLVVLDNIEEPALLAELVPASPSATVILISRVNAAAFLAEGAERIEVAPFNHDHSKTLLEKVCGPRRLRDEPQAVDGLLELCAGRPGTVALLGGCLATSPTLSLSELLRDIAARSKGRSHETATIIARRIVIESLGAPVRELYRMLSAHPGEDFPPALAEELAGEAAATLLREMEDKQLLTAKPSGRWRMAGGSGNDPEAARPILDWYLAMARRADTKAMGPKRLRLSEVDDTTARDPHWDEPGDALDWLEAEASNLVALQRFAVDHGWDDAAVAIEESLWVLYVKRPFPGYQESTSRLAIEAARRLSDRRLESRMRAQRGRCLWKSGAYEGALEESLRARELAVGEDNLEGSAAEMTGRVYLRLGQYDDAIEIFDFAVRIYERIGNTRGTALARQFAAQAHTGKREYERAGSLLHQALKGFAATNATGDRGRALIDLAKLEIRLDSEAPGAFPSKSGGLESVLSILDDAERCLWANGMHLRLAEAVTLHGDVLLALDRPEEARGAWQQALDLQLSQHNGEGPEASQLRAKLSADHPE
ncbi:MAG: tetratricopeptide repeat protein, partial [Stackebrandtia sp.]